VSLFRRATNGDVAKVATREDDEQQLRTARVEAVRKTHWTELEQADLVPRGPFGWLVHAQSDCVYRLYRGAVFDRGTIGFASPDAALAYYVTARNEVVVLERLTHPASWSAFVERNARQEAAAR
jgi:hypothetical protein